MKEFYLLFFMIIARIISFSIQSDIIAINILFSDSEKDIAAPIKQRAEIPPRAALVFELLYFTVVIFNIGYVAS